MIIEKVQRVANPTRRKRRYKNPKKRIKLSAAQIAAGFGGKRRQAAAKTKHRRRRVAVASNPLRRKSAASRSKGRNARVVTRHRRRKTTKNPQILTLGHLINPERTKMRKRKKSAHRRRRVAVAASPRRRRRHLSAATANPRRRRRAVSNPRRRRRIVANPRRRATRRHHHPAFLGTGMEAVGVLGGVAAQKFAKGFIPASLITSPLMATAASFALAFGLGKLADMAFKGKPVGKGIALGALASAASDGINAFLPSLSPTLGLQGFGHFGVYQDARFAVPENPIMRALPQASVPVASAAGPGVGMLNAAFGHSF